MNSSLFKNTIPHIAAILIFLTLASIYFWPQFSGQQIRQSDLIHYLGMAQEARDYEKETGEKTLWTNSMFGGMPTYQINTVSEGNQLRVIDKVLRLFDRSDNALGRFFMAMAGFYILLVVLGVNPWLSIGGAIAFGFSTNNLILYEAGQMTKLKSVIYLPIITAGLLLAFQKKYLWGGLLFALGLGLNLMVNHVQMTYYFFLSLLFFGIAQLVYSIRNNEIPHFLKASGIILFAMAIALGTAASNLWVTYEYSKDTMRGEPILVSDKATSEIKTSSETDGLEWNYAMQWSNGYIDFFASFIPGVAGGGSNEPIGKNSPLFKDPQWRQFLTANGLSNFSIYWGKLSFTSGPIYFGAVVFLLFLIGLGLVDGPVKWWLGLGSLLIMAFSMGDTLESFNRFFFDYIPLFNKFRAPNSALSVVVFLFPLLGFLGLSKMIKGEVSKEQVRKSLLIAGGITAALFLFFAVLGPSMFTFSKEGDGRWEQYGLSIQPLIDTRKSLMRGDAFYALFLAGIAWVLMWFYNQGKLKQAYLTLGISLLILVDVFKIGARYVWHDDYQARTEISEGIPPNAADNQILAYKQSNPDEVFRVYDVLQNPFTSSRASYFHHSLGGYHAAKLQRYQDIMDRHLVKGNQKVIDMLNTKFFIAPGQQEGQAPRAQQNPGAAGNAWFVNNIQTVESANAEIDALNEFEPTTDAIVHQEFQGYTAGLEYRDSISSGNIQLTEYKPNHLIYESNSTKDRLAVFSEIWYGPDKGWQAYIDDQPVDHIRANYVLRAMKVPAGQHKIEFKFDPKSFQTGVNISWITSSLLLLALIGGLIFAGYQYFQKMKNQPQTPPTTEKKSKTTVKTTATKKRLEKEKSKEKGKKTKAKKK